MFLLGFLHAMEWNLRVRSEKMVWVYGDEVVEDWFYCEMKLDETWDQMLLEGKVLPLWCLWTLEEIAEASLLLGLQYECQTHPVCP